VSVAADTVTAHEQRSALGRHRRQQVPRLARFTENVTTKLVAEGLTALTEALRGLDAKLRR
jgi:hypothetical protein